jgi:ADP-glucose pyrophosphorylase
MSVLFSDKSHSLGDCLREISSMMVLKEDFLLIKGSCVTNINFNEVIEKYENAAKANKNMIMLKLFTKGSTLSEIRRPEENVYLLLDKDDKIMYYENIRHNQFVIPESFRVEFKRIEDYTLRYDLFDTMISICHLNVLNYYNENFDYHNEREFLKDLLYSEISSECVSVLELSKEDYALDVKSPHLLLKANLDGLKWYIEFMVNFDSSSSSRYKERFVRSNQTHSFYSKEAKLDFDCKLGTNTLVCEGCELLKDSQVDNSIIQRNVHVGAKATIQRSILASESSVGCGSAIRDSSIGRKVKIGKNCKIRYAVIEEGAAIADNEVIENIRVKIDGNRVPFQGNTLWCKQIVEDDFEFDFGQEEIENEGGLVFDSEVQATVCNAVANQYSIGEIVNEVTSLKLSMNKSMIECIKACTNSVMLLLSNQLAQADKSSIVKVMEDTLTYWKPLFRKFVTNEEEENFLINCVQEKCEQDSHLKIHLILQMMYKKEMVHSKPILNWYEGLADGEQNEKTKVIVSSLSKFVEYLKEAEDSSGTSENEEKSESESNGSQSEESDNN